MELSLNEGICYIIFLFIDWLKSWKYCEVKKFYNGIFWIDEQFKFVGDFMLYSVFCKLDICGLWELVDCVYIGS